MSLQSGKPLINILDTIRETHFNPAVVPSVMAICYSLSPLDLELRVPFTTAYGTITKKRHLLVTVSDGSYAGYGEVLVVDSPSPRYPLTRDVFKSHLLSRKRQSETPLINLDDDILDAAAWLPVNRQLRSGVEMALYDLQLRRHNESLSSYVAVDKRSFVTFGITTGDPGRVLDAFSELCDRSPLVKVKLSEDEAYARLVLGLMADRKEKNTFSVDMNGAWTPEIAVRNHAYLRDSGASIVEQPFSPDIAGRAHLAECVEVMDAWRKVSDLLRSDGIKVYADESFIVPKDLVALNGIIDGVVVKLEKNSGISRAAEHARQARYRGLEVMVGSNITSSHTTSAALLLKSYADHLDLDGSQDIWDDPFSGAKVAHDGAILLPQSSGLSTPSPAIVLRQS